MEEINILGSGDSFGQDSLLSEHKMRRNASCQVLSENVIAAVLTKNDFRRVLIEQERIKIDSKINLIHNFELFKSVTKRRLKNFYRLFYDKSTERPYNATRN